MGDLAIFLDDYGYIMLMVFCIFCLLLFSAFFSASETAMTALSRARLVRLVADNNRRAKLIHKLLESPSTMITSILVGNNAVNIIASVLATSLLLDSFGSSGIFYASFIMTVLIVIFAEILPKNFALVDAQRIAFFTAGLLSLLVKILSPIVYLIRPLVRYVLRKSNKNRENIFLAQHVIEELRGVIELSRQEGGVGKPDHDMLDGVLDLADLSVYDVMIHRIKFYAIDVNQPTEVVIDKLTKSPYTRMPVFSGTQDNIIGVIDIKSVMRDLLGKKMDITKFNLHDVISSPWFVPESTNLKEQLNAFLKKKRHFAITVDEYGEVMGLITLEDILEEIVGQITDEYDPPEIDSKPDDLGAIEVRGSLSVRELNRIKDWKLPDDRATTIAGLVIDQAEIIPEVGQSFNFFGFRFKIVKREGNRITRIRVRPSGGFYQEKGISQEKEMPQEKKISKA